MLITAKWYIGLILFLMLLSIVQWITKGVKRKITKPIKKVEKENNFYTKENIFKPEIE